jgi:hypothetical protein
MRLSIDYKNEPIDGLLLKLIKFSQLTKIYSFMFPLKQIRPHIIIHILHNTYRFFCEIILKKSVQKLHITLKTNTTSHGACVKDIRVQFK